MTTSPVPVLNIYSLVPGDVIEIACHYCGTWWTYQATVIDDTAGGVVVEYPVYALWGELRRGTLHIEDGIAVLADYDGKEIDVTHIVKETAS